MSLFTFSVICYLDDVSFESILKPIIPACQFESLNYTRLSISTTQGSQPFLSNFSWFSWLFFAIFMVFMVIFSLKFITWFSCFFGHNLMSFYSKLNFDVAKFLLYFVREKCWLFCSPRANFFDYFARQAKIWGNFGQKSLFSCFFWTN